MVSSEIKKKNRKVVLTESANRLKQTISQLESKVDFQNSDLLSAAIKDKIGVYKKELKQVNTKIAGLNRKKSKKKTPNRPKSIQVNTSNIQPLKKQSQKLNVIRS